MKKLVLIGIILTILFKTTIIAENKFEDGQVLRNILEDMDATQLEEDISINAKILDRFIYEDEMEKLGEEIRDNIGIIGTQIDPLIEYDILPETFFTKTKIFEKNFSQVNYSGFDKDKNRVEIFLSSYLDEDENLNETYLYINFVKRKQFWNKNDTMENIKSIFEKFDSKVEITTCVLGDFSGELGYNNMEDKINIIKGRYNIEILESFIDDNLYSYTMYTPLIKEILLIDKKKINLNLAIRYNVYEDKTYIMIGSPIIANGY